MGLAPWKRLLALPAIGLLLAATLAQAQYKVVGPDGRITYTDVPPLNPGGSQVQPLRRDGAAASPAAAQPGAGPALPAELRAVVARFPVTLYTSNDCAPCQQGRNLLVQRGIPYSERSVASDDDIAALQRLTAGRSVPALMVGAQALRGFQDADWQATLDLAGYPPQSRLPRNWQAAPPTPLVARAIATAAPGTGNAAGPVTINIAPGASSQPDPAPPPAAAGSGAIRF